MLRALALRYGLEASGDATAACFAYAWEHWDEVKVMDNPRGYLYRVAQTSQRRRRSGHLPSPAQIGLPSVEPGLIPALRALPLTQRSAVWLVYACEWTYSETAEALGVSPSTIGTHLQRGLAALRSRMGVDADAHR